MLTHFTRSIRKVPVRQVSGLHQITNHTFAEKDLVRLFHLPLMQREVPE